MNGSDMNAKKTVKRGPRMEYLVAAVLQGEGYLVRRALPVQFGPEKQDVTDVDVIGLRFSRPFQLHQVICDCKDKRISKPFERIFWAKGLAEFLGADEVYVALPKASVSTIKFGRSGRVRVLNNEVLKDQYKKTYGSEKAAYGLANPEVSVEMFDLLDKLSKKDKNLASFRSEVGGLYLLADPYVGVNLAHGYTVDIGQRLSKADEGSDFQFVWRYLISELIVVLCVFLLKISADTLGLSSVERKSHIVERLTFGSIAPDKAREIFKLAKELAAESVRSMIAPDKRQTRLPFESQAIEPPHYAPDIAGLVERTIANPALYHELPQLMDFLLFEQALQNRVFSDDSYRKTFPAQYADERLKAARNILTFVRDSTGLKLGSFWPKHDQSKQPAIATPAKVGKK